MNERSARELVQHRRTSSHAGRAGWPLHVLALLSAALMVTAHVAGGQTVEAETTERPWPGDLIFYELDVFDPSGDLLYSPRLIGAADKPARIDLWGNPRSRGCRKPGLGVFLDTLAARDGLDVSMDLTVGGLVDHHRLRLRMSMNESRRLRVPTDDGGELLLSLRAFKVDSQAFEEHLDALERAGALDGTPRA